MTRLAAAAVLLLVGATPALAADRDAASPSDALFAALAACRAEPDAARLACLDRATAQLLAARDNRQFRVVDREAVRRTKRSLFGFASITTDLFGGGKDEKDGKADDGADDIKEITAAVTQSSQLPSGLWMISLSEGGSWQTIGQAITFAPKVGDQVTIKAGMLGHFTARIGRGRVVDVKRLR